MVEEGLLLDEQTKKKKRFVLLALLTLLLVATLAALPWLPGPPAPASAVAEKGSPTPAPTATTVVSQATPEAKTSPGSQETAGLSPLTPEPLPIGQATPTPTLEAAPAVKTTTPGDTATPVAATPSATAAARKTPTVTKTPIEVQGNEWPEVGAPSAGDGSQPGLIEATKESPRYDGPEIPAPTITTTLTVSSNENLVPTATLTSSTQLTNTSALGPPDGLPVTGINLPRKVNWAALGMMILLLGTGVAALLRSEVEQE